MTKAHLISTATALSLGYAAGFSADNLVAATSVPTQIQQSVSKRVPKANSIVSGIRDNVVTALCDDAETAAGLDAGDCARANACRVTLNYCDGDGTETDKVAVVADFIFPGTITLADPQ